MRRWLLMFLALCGGISINLLLQYRDAGGGTRHVVAKPVVAPSAGSSDEAAEGGTAPAGKPAEANRTTKTARSEATNERNRVSPTLADLASGQLAIVDLGWPLNAHSAYWPGDNYKPFELHTLATLEKDGVLSKAFSTPEHLGTHLDAPNHFERDRQSVDEIPPAHLFSPGVVIDIAAACSRDSDYRLSVADVEAFEAAHGRIPQGAVVLAYTGWSKFWNSPERYQNKDVMSRLHFPGFSAEAARLLIEERRVRGLGLDTLSVDHGVSRDFPVHHLLGKANCYGLENLRRLEELPPRGFTLIVAPVNIETGSGGPARVFAVMHDIPAN